jgi:hypothetical protein
VEAFEPLELDEELVEELDSDFFGVDFLSEPPEDVLSEDLVSEDFLGDELALASALESVR